MISILVCCLLFQTSAPSDGMVVITATATPIETISKVQLRRLYLSRIDRIRGIALVPLQLAAPSEIRTRFIDWLFGPGFDLENHWIEERLRGGASPPLEVVNTAHMLIYVERNPGYIGFLPAERLDSLDGFDLKVLRVR